MNDKVKKKMKPRIFISSTFYDLKYIREELMRFIVSKNYEPILFENGNIGYTPNRALDISCYEAMKNSDMDLHRQLITTNLKNMFLSQGKNSDQQMRAKFLYTPLLTAKYLPNMNYMSEI